MTAQVRCATIDDERDRQRASVAVSGLWGRWRVARTDERKQKDLLHGVAPSWRLDISSSVIW